MYGSVILVLLCQQLGLIFSVIACYGENAYRYICLSLLMKHTFFFHGFIQLNFFYEFPVYVLSQLALVP